MLIFGVLHYLPSDTITEGRIQEGNFFEGGLVEFLLYLEFFVIFHLKPQQRGACSRGNFFKRGISRIFNIFVVLHYLPSDNMLEELIREGALRQGSVFERGFSRIIAIFTILQCFLSDNMLERGLILKRGLFKIPYQRREVNEMTNFEFMNL